MVISRSDEACVSQYGLFVEQRNAPAFGKTENAFVASKVYRRKIYKCFLYFYPFLRTIKFIIFLRIALKIMKDKQNVII